MSRRDRVILRAAAIWTVWIWGTRIWNIWNDPARDLPFKAVHTVLAAVSLVFAVAIWGVATRSRKRAGGREAVGSRGQESSQRRPPEGALP